MSSRTSSRFSDALRFARKAKSRTQEDFETVTSRVYVSALERGRKQPTLATVEGLSTVIGVHPLTLLVLSYCDVEGGLVEDVDTLLQRVRDDVKELCKA